MMEPWKSDSQDAWRQEHSSVSSDIDPPSFDESFYHRTPVGDDVEVERMPLWKRVVWIVAILVGSWFSWGMYEARQPLPEAGPFPEPVQVELDSPMRLPGPDGIEFEATDTYDITALVLSRARYRFDGQAGYCPVDLALAWGKMTSREALDAVKYSQSGRWFWFNVKSGTNYTLSDVVQNAANTHMIPATGDDGVRADVLNIRRGDTVRIQGYLVNVVTPRGVGPKSSRVRTDGGGGSCEIVYVTQVDKLN